MSKRLDRKVCVSERVYHALRAITVGDPKQHHFDELTKFYNKLKKTGKWKNDRP